MYMNTIYLKNAEQQVYDLLPADLRAGWTVLEETFTKYESNKQIQTRYFLADFTAYPEVGDLLGRMKANPASVKIEDFADIDYTVQQELYFMMGARGIEHFVAAILPHIKNDDDVQALSNFTTIRHKLLELNSQSTYE